MSRTQPHVWWRKVKEMPLKKGTQGIQEARDALRPIPVIPGVPSRARILLYRSFDGWCPREFCDHAGVSWIPNKIDGVWHWNEVIVSEPYGYSHIAEAEEIAKKYGAHFYLSANSWWFPGHSYRHEFWPTKLGHILIAMVPDIYSQLDSPIPESRIIRFENLKKWRRK